MIVLIMAHKSLATRSLKCQILDMAWSPQRWFSGQDEIIRPWYLRGSTQGMRCDRILGQGSRNLRGVLDDFLHALILTWVID